MSGTFGLPEKGFFTPPRQKIPSATTPGTSYSPAENLKISTPELLRQAKEGQDKEEAAAAKKGGKSRRRKGSKKTRKTRGRGRRITKSRK
jgi:hypothetical protein